MSGETESQVSGWTTDTLHSHMARMREADQRLDDERTLRLEQAIQAEARFDAERDRRYTERAAAQESAVASALRSAEKAVEKAEMASEKRFDGVNEFRAALADSTSKNLSRVEYNAAHTNLVDRVNEVSDRVKGIEATGRGRVEATKEVRTQRVDTVSLVVAGFGVVGVLSAIATIVITVTQ